MDLLLIKHGIFHLVIGILAGMPYLKAISKVKENKEQWRILHLAAILSGVMLIALGSVYDKLPFIPLVTETMVYGFIISNWTFNIGMILSGYTGERGLSPRTKSPAGLTIFGLYCFSAFVSSTATFSLLYIAFKL